MSLAEEAGRKMPGLVPRIRTAAIERLPIEMAIC
jgi:hypothetical protein